MKLKNFLIIFLLVSLSDQVFARSENERSKRLKKIVSPGIERPERIEKPGDKLEGLTKKPKKPYVPNILYYGTPIGNVDLREDMYRREDIYRVDQRKTLPVNPPSTGKYDKIIKKIKISFSDIINMLTGKFIKGNTFPDKLVKSKIAPSYPLTIKTKTPPPYNLDPTKWSPEAIGVGTLPPYIFDREPATADPVAEEFEWSDSSFGDGEPDDPVEPAFDLDDDPLFSDYENEELEEIAPAACVPGEDDCPPIPPCDHKARQYAIQRGLPVGPCTDDSDDYDDDDLGVPVLGIPEPELCKYIDKSGKIYKRPCMKWSSGVVGKQMCQYVKGDKIITHPCNTDDVCEYVVGDKIILRQPCENEPSVPLVPLPLEESPPSRGLR